jgi:membrane-anchored protein YejM (alkaline phosphatase superfamily)
MFYGLHASDGLSFEEARRGPLLFRRLLDLDYDVRVVASRGTRFPLFRETVFADVTGRVEDDLPGATSAEKDVALLERARAVLRGRDAGRPFFLGLFVDSTHLPYAFPPERAHYRPYSDHLYYTEMTSPLPREPIYNRYRNAVAWVDHVVGEVLRALDETGPADDTLVVITGDHGQEFYEHGVLGHNVTFSREQIRVPLLLRGPGLSPGDRLELTRHVDLAATLLDVLGVENDPAELGFGRSLLRAGEAPYAVSCGNARCALVEPDGTVAVFSTTTATPEYAFFDGEYRPLPPSAVSRAPHLGDVVQELRRFRR